MIKHRFRISNSITFCCWPDGCLKGKTIEGSVLLKEACYERENNRESVKTVRFERKPLETADSEADLREFFDAYSSKSSSHANFASCTSCYEFERKKSSRTAVPQTESLGMWLNWR